MNTTIKDDDEILNLIEDMKITKREIIENRRDLNEFKKEYNKMKILQWNKGNSQIIYKMNEIKDIMKEKKPSIFIINELNIDDITNVMNININGYTLELDELRKNGMSRTGMYIKNNLNYTRKTKYDYNNE